jgi:hypothetical protein
MTLGPLGTVRWIRAEIVYLAWRAQLRRYCTPCDQLHWAWNLRHRKHGCAGLWRV